VLGSVTPYHQPGVYQHLDVLRDSRERQIKRFGEFVDGRVALSQAGQDRSPSRVRQHGEGLAEAVLADRRSHGSSDTFHIS
jgi:hypothetical protein